MEPIELSDKQSVAWEFLEDQVTNEIFYGGAAGGGKSYLACIWHIYRRTTYPGSRGLIGRAKLKSLEESTLNTLFAVADKMGYKQGTHFKYNAQKHVITWWNGSKTILADLFYYPSDPDFISLGSTEYTDAILEECLELTLKALEIVSSRIRWKLDEFGLAPKVLLTGNPGEGWVKERFIEKDGKAVKLKPHQKFVQSLVTENPNKEFVKLYVEQLSRMSSEYDKARLLRGSWDARREVLNPFAVQWDDIKHLTERNDYHYTKNLIISVDFNLTPFCVTFWHYWIDKEGEHVQMFDEGEIEQGSIPAMIEFIKARYEVSLPTAVITGDAMGKRKELSQKDNASNFKQLIRGLGMRESQLHVTYNPSHKKSKADVNYVLMNHPDFRINEKCFGTINDMRNVQVDATGEIMKGDRKDLNQRADFLDTVRYFVHNMMRKWIDRHQKQTMRIKS